MIDAKSNRSDVDFIVLINQEKPANFVETSTTVTERRLKIELPADARTIEIIGTSIIPEFPISILAVSGAIVAMVMFTRMKKVFTK